MTGEIFDLFQFTSCKKKQNQNRRDSEDHTLTKKLKQVPTYLELSLRKGMKVPMTICMPSWINITKAQEVEVERPLPNQHFEEEC